MSELLQPFDKLKDFVTRVWLSYGFNKIDAEDAAHNLCLADLRGIDSHGVARLSGFCKLIEKGRINPKPTFKWLKNKLSAGSIDADGGIGLISAKFAMEQAIEKASKTGTAFITVSNSNHFGIAGAHTELAARKNMIGWAMTNASPLVAPFGAKGRLFGTNPISIAIPNPLFGEGNPIILDMATSAAANGKMEIAARKQKNIPIGWAIDKDGNSTNDPNILKSGGALLPLGSDDEHGVHKGYGLGAMVDILSGVLSGASFSVWAPPFVDFLEPKSNAPGKGLGHIVGAMDIEAFMDFDEFAQKMKIWSEAIKQTPTQNGEPLILHGEPEFEFEKIRKKNGIPLSEKVWDDLKVIENQRGVLL